MGSDETLDKTLDTNDIGNYVYSIHDSITTSIVYHALTYREIVIVYVSIT